MQWFDPRMAPSRLHNHEHTHLRKYIAVNAIGRGRFMHINCLDGQVYLSATTTPSEDIPVSKSSKNDEYDAGLVWMETLAEKLEREEIEIGICNPTKSDNSLFKILLHYPTLKCKRQLGSGSNTLPIVSHAITKGIEVIASSHCDPVMNGIISYSIRLRILTEGEEGYMTELERGYKSCQLMSRHWVILYGETGEEDTVVGDGVIGLYPVLYENLHRVDFTDSFNNLSKGRFIREGTFRYQSNVSSSCTSLRGRIRFMPGSMDCPTGSPFFVDLAPFALVSSSDIIF